MSTSNQYIQDCPNCGKKNGATGGSLDWGHDYLCCSEACGRAYASSERRWHHEAIRAQQQLDEAKRRADECFRELERAAKRAKVAQTPDELRATCRHDQVVYQPVGGDAEGWIPRWVCGRCSREFVPVGQTAMERLCRTGK